MRYFLSISYDGLPYVGWQSQPNGHSVQSEVEAQMEILLRRRTPLTGCGRTDAGVHARRFYAHFDVPDPLDETFCYRLNQLLPASVGIRSVISVASDAHARFDACSRSYAYRMHRDKDPFLVNRSYRFYDFAALNRAAMQEASHLLLNYDAFLPFCKSKSDVKHHRCHLSHAAWQWEDDRGTFEISANRFLRGMVRLVVGMCIRVGLGKQSIADLKEALDQQRRLTQDLSAPAHGLYLTEVKYPYAVE